MVENDAHSLLLKLRPATSSLIYGAIMMAFLYAVVILILYFAGPHGLDWPFPLMIVLFLVIMAASTGGRLQELLRQRRRIDEMLKTSPL